MNIKTKIKHILFSVTAALGLMTVFALPAQAVVIEATYEGTVTDADSSNPFGVSTGDSVWVTAEWDDEDVDGTSSYEELWDWISLVVTIGSAVFEGDQLYDTLVFDYGTLVGFYLDYIPSSSYDGELYADGGPFFSAYGFNDTAVQGYFDMSPNACKDCGGDDKPVSVPEPGTLGLLGLGLLSIAVRRRRQTLAI